MATLVVFTDLDGTLLDHDHYGWKPATAVIDQLRERSIPLVLVTSKTRAEVKRIRVSLGNGHPFVTENGAAIHVPVGYFAGVSTTAESPCVQEQSGRGYADIVEVLHDLRGRHQYRFKGFADHQPASLAALTGLSLGDAGRALQRDGSEPIDWQGSDASLATFRVRLQEAGLSLLRGGRFFHVVADGAHGGGDKGAAVAKLLERYRLQSVRTDASAQVRSVALGDAQNDLPMFDQVDVAVVIPTPRGESLRPVGAAELHTASEPGPLGWATEMGRILGCERPPQGAGGPGL